jgi:hypothetical protein
MADFPTDWDVFPVTEFATFHQEDRLEDPMGMTTLLKLGPDGKSTGIFKVILFGGGVVDIPIPVTDILHEPPPHIASMVIKLSVRADKTNIAQNSTTSAWRDLLTLLRGKSATVTDLNGDKISSESLVKYLEGLAGSQDKNTDGASIRWAVAGSEDGGLQLEVQSLPTQARYLTKAALRKDNCVSVLQGFFPLKMDRFAGQDPGGPVPVFFAEDRDAALAWILQNPDQLRTDIATLNASFFRMEHLSVEDAHKYLQGKARPAKGVPIFPSAMGPPAKKPRQSLATPRETGRILYSHNRKCKWERILKNL